MAKPSLQFHDEIHTPQVELFDKNTTAIFKSGTDPFVITSRSIAPDEEVKLKVSRGSSSHINFHFAFIDINPKDYKDCRQHVLQFVGKDTFFYQLDISKPIEYLSLHYDSKGTLNVNQNGEDFVFGFVDVASKPWVLFYLEGERQEFAPPSICLIEPPKCPTGGVRGSKSDSFIYSGDFHQSHGDGIRLENYLATCITNDTEQNFVFSNDPIRPNEIIRMKMIKCKRFAFGLTALNPVDCKSTKQVKEATNSWMHRVQLITTNCDMYYAYNGNADINTNIDGKWTTFLRRNINIEEPLWAVVLMYNEGAAVALEIDKNRPKIVRTEIVKEPITEKSIACGESKIEDQILQLKQGLKSFVINRNAKLEDKVKSNIEKSEACSKLPAIAANQPSVKFKQNIHNEIHSEINHQPLQPEVPKKPFTQIQKSSDQNDWHMDDSEIESTKKRIKSELGLTRRESYDKAWEELHQLCVQAATYLETYQRAPYVERDTEEEPQLVNGKPKRYPHVQFRLENNQVIAESTKPLAIAIPKEKKTKTSQHEPSLLLMESTNQKPRSGCGFKTLDLITHRRYGEQDNQQAWYYSQRPVNEAKRIILRIGHLTPRTHHSDLLVGVMCLRDPKNINWNDVPRHSQLISNTANGWCTICCVPVVKPAEGIDVTIYFNEGGVYIRKNEEDVHSAPFLIPEGKPQWWFVNLNGIVYAEFGILEES